MSDETTRLRALLERATQTPWRQDGCEITVVGSTLGVDGGETVVAECTLPDCIVVANEDREEQEERNAALIVGAVNALPGLLDAAERAERAERERDDLAATLETRTAEHALAMARVRELEAIIAGRTTPPTDEGEGDGGETPAEIVARLRRHANEARRCAAWEHSQGMHLAAENSCRDARDFDAQADRMATAEVSRG